MSAVVGRGGSWWQAGRSGLDDDGGPDGCNRTQRGGWTESDVVAGFRAEHSVWWWGRAR